MKYVEKVLKTKLASYGIDVENNSEKLSQLDLSAIEKNISNEIDVDKYIAIKQYTEPTSEVSRMLINYNQFYVSNLIVSGQINFSTITTSIGTRFPVADYNLDETICIVAPTKVNNIEVLVYTPSNEVRMQYAGQTYESIVLEERNSIAKEYYEAFIENGRVSEGKVKNIMSLLLSEYIIDEMIIDNQNPKLKMYDNPDAYAENITEYRLKYINRKTNKIEMAIKSTNIKRLGANVIAGIVSNDPYIRLQDVSYGADFPLNTISCYWASDAKGKKDEVSIYIASKKFDNVQTYREYQKMNTTKYDEVINAVQAQFERELGRMVMRDYVKSVILKLNPELVVPSIAIIRDCMDNPLDPIDPIKYKFKATMDPAEFEEKLYVSIEDNIGSRYKYKMPESIFQDTTRIGNKLEYTDKDGSIVKKQSIADFNINARTAVIRRETLIDYSNIKGLLGYIYEDMEYLGTDMLPVPSLEVDFFFPKLERKEISMFNGTGETTESSSFNKFNEMNSDDSSVSVPGTTSAIVRYVDSSGKVLKENVVNNLYAGNPFVPEILPIINDQEGKEWICATTQFPSTIINLIPEYNVIEIKYREKFAKATITFLGRDGKKIRDDVIETVQVGSTYDLSTKQIYRDDEKNDWELVSSRPSKFIVKDDDNNNHLILTYDIEKEPVIIKYLNTLGENIIEPKSEEFQVGKVYAAQIEKTLIDSNGKGWIYNGKNPIEVLVESGKESVIETKYDEYKLPVTTKYQTEEGIPVLNDKIEFVQVGMPYTPQYDNDVNDNKLREWRYKSGAPDSFVTSQDEKNNIIKIIYEPKLANVSIQMINEDGNSILNPEHKQCQIGEEFASVYKSEIVDNYGKMWIQKGEPDTLIVSKKESENNIVIKYKPLISEIVVKFFDDERNELIPSKSYKQQVGTIFKPDIIEKLESDDGRRWFLSKEKAEEITVKKNVEENIISVFYERELTDIELEFVDVYGKKLKDSITIKEQIGSTYNPKSFDVIEDYEKYKWMIESTEPKKLVVKNSDNKFKLVYGELKAIVVVKYTNVKTNKSVIDDIIAKVKLGGIYVPNIQTRILDKNKCAWKYVGDTNLSIVVKENEQENIIVLQYDEALTDVVVKYQDIAGKSLRDDYIYSIQIGKPIDKKNIEKLIDSNGIGWKNNSSKSDFVNAEEKDNVVINTYVPYKVDVKTRYLNESNEEIIKSKIDEVQIGKMYEVTHDRMILSDNKLLWIFKNGTEGHIKVGENGNVIDLIYEPRLSKVTERHLNKTGETIFDDAVRNVQVGASINFEPEGILTDKESKKWNYIKNDRKQIIVSENDDENVVNEFYEERKAKVLINFTDDENHIIHEPESKYVQVGSKYVLEIPNTIVDNKTKLGWKLPDAYEDTIIIDEDEAKNVSTIKYEKYLAKVTKKCVDMNNNDVLPEEYEYLQVGSQYVAKAEKNIIDESGKEWYNGRKREKGLSLFDDKTSDSNSSIVVSENENNNIIVFKYNPTMAKVVVKYQNNLGGIIAKSDEFEAQIGSEFAPEIKSIIKDSKQHNWVFNPNSKSSIKVSKDEKQNVVLLSYEEEKSPVVYKYQDEFKNRLKSPKKVLAQIGSIYVPEIDNVIEDDHGKVWEYKEADVDKIEIKDNEQENVVVVTYIPLLVEVELNIHNMKGELITTITEKAQLGSKFTPSIDERIFDDNSLMYKFIKCEPKELIIKEVPIGSTEKINVFNLTYEPVYSNAIIIFQDIDGNELKERELIQLHVGTKYTPKLIQYVTDKKGIQWENINQEVDTIRIMENEKDNIIKMTFELAKADVTIRFNDLYGNTIKESEHIQANIGTEFIPKINNIIQDAKNRKWVFTASDPVKLDVGSINNIINLVYQEKKSVVTIKYQTMDGRKLREDTKESVQEGVQFIPKKNFAIIYDENEIWRYSEFRPSSLLVTDNVQENVIVQVYDNKADEVNKKPKLENPFAVKDNDKEENGSVTENEPIGVIDDNVDGKQKDNTISNDGDIEYLTGQEENNDLKAEDSSEFEFKEQNLIDLSKSLLLDNSEKRAIVKLNDIDKAIIGELNSFKNSFDLNSQESTIARIDELMNREKEIIKNELPNMFLKDKTGKRFLKIMEAIVKDDVDCQRIQERKIILLTDFFVNNDITDMDQAIYICERGKNTKELELMASKVGRNIEYKEMYIELLYEKSMLDSYYRTRTESKDNYFESESDRGAIGSEIGTLISNMLTKQAFNLLQKNKLNVIQQNELEAIIRLLNDQQRIMLEKMISEIKDSKIKKEMSKKLKEIKK